MPYTYLNELVELFYCYGTKCEVDLHRLGILILAKIVLHHSDIPFIGMCIRVTASEAGLG